MEILEKIAILRGRLLSDEPDPEALKMLAEIEAALPAPLTEDHIARCAHDLWRCAAAWDPDARLLGDLTAREIAEVARRATRAPAPLTMTAAVTDPEDPIDAEDLWTDYCTERPHVTASDRLAFLEGVGAARRTATRPAPAPSTMAGTANASALLYGPARAAMAETAAVVPATESAAAAFWRGVEHGRGEARKHPDALVLMLDAGTTDDQRAALVGILGRLRGVAAVKPTRTTPVPSPERQCVAVICTNAVNNVLVVQSKKRDLWELPGGWAEGGEPAPEAAIREAREETGIEVSIRDLLKIERMGPIVLSVFAGIGDGKPVAGGDVTSATWWTASQVLSAYRGGVLSDVPSREALLTWAGRQIVAGATGPR